MRWFGRGNGGRRHEHSHAARSRRDAGPQDAQPAVVGSPPPQVTLGFDDGTRVHLSEGTEATKALLEAARHLVNGVEDG